jgi:hypothetical protein
MLMKAITVAIVYRRTEVFEYLFPFYQDFFGPPGITRMQKWLPAAICAGDFKIATVLLSMDHQAGSQTIYDAFRLACIYPVLHPCKTFFDTGALKVNTVYESTVDGPTYPLATAIQQRNLPVVSLLMELGANPDEPYIHGKMQTPLAAAFDTLATPKSWTTETAFGDVLIMLLKSGASPYGVSDQKWKARKQCVTPAQENSVQMYIVAYQQRHPEPPKTFVEVFPVLEEVEYVPEELELDTGVVDQEDQAYLEDAFLEDGEEDFDFDFDFDFEAVDDDDDGETEE